MMRPRVREAVWKPLSSFSGGRALIRRSICAWRRSEIPYLQAQQRALFKKLGASQTDSCFVVSACGAFVVFACSLYFRSFAIKISIGFEGLRTSPQPD